MCHLSPLQAPIICLLTRKRQMGIAMEAPPEVPVSVEGPVSIVRLHGEACFYCGAVSGDLYAAGSITLPGSDQVWPIVTCGCHTPGQP